MKFVIADDHPLFREALSGALTPLFEGLEVLEAESTDALIDLLARSKDVDLLLLAALRRPGLGEHYGPTGIGGAGLAQ